MSAERQRPLRTPERLRGRASTALTAVVAVAAVLGVQLTLFPVPLGVWLQGVVLGLLGSLMALGLGLTYRLNKVINFAQGDLGTAPAVLAFGLIAFSGVNYFLGLATGWWPRSSSRRPSRSLSCAASGARPDWSSRWPPSGCRSCWWWSASSSRASGARRPFRAPWCRSHGTFSWHVDPVVFNANDLVAVVVSVACLVGVTLWFTRSDVGIAVQAAGDRRDRASMLGIPVGRLQSVTWVVAGVLSFLSIFFQAAIVGLPLDPTFGLTALVTALAALALGNFTELPVIAASAVALGVLSRAWPGTSPPTRPSVLAVLAAVVFAAIVVRQILSRRTDREAETTLALASSVRDLPAAAGIWSKSASGCPPPGWSPWPPPGTLPLWLGAGELLRASDTGRPGGGRLLDRGADRLVRPGEPGADVLRRRRGRRRARWRCSTGTGT